MDRRSDLLHWDPDAPLAQVFYAFRSPVEGSVGVYVYDVVAEGRQAAANPQRV